MSLPCTAWSIVTPNVHAWSAARFGRRLDLDVRDLARVEVLADRLLVLEPVEHDDREDLVLLDQLLGLVLADLGLRLGVLDDHLDLAAVDAALGLRSFQYALTPLSKCTGIGAAPVIGRR